MNIQFSREFLMEDVKDIKQATIEYLTDYCGASPEAAEMLGTAVKAGMITYDKALAICSATTGISEDGGSTTAGVPGISTKMAFGENAPMLAAGKANLSTYKKDGFTAPKGRAKLKSIQPKDVWDTLPTTMSEREQDTASELLSLLAAPAFKQHLAKLSGEAPEKWEVVSQLYDTLYAELRKSEALQENYHRFKRETKERPKEEQYHQAIKAVNKKLDQVNRILEFTTRMKTELAEGGDLGVKTRTVEVTNRLKMKIAEAYKKLKNL